MAMSPDGTVLAIGEQDSAVTLWDVRGRQYYPSFTPGGPVVTGLAFSADSRLLASGTADGVVQLWDPTQVNDQHHFDFPPQVVVPSGVGSLAFSPDGTILAVGGNNGTIHLLGLPGMRPHGLPVIAHTGAVDTMAFSREGAILASLGLDDTLRLWDLTHQAWQQQACRVANRNLTLDEWRQYMGSIPYHKTCPALP
jgi:WD40 repeat protein